MWGIRVCVPALQLTNMCCSMSPCRLCCTNTKTNLGHDLVPYGRKKPSNRWHIFVLVYTTHFAAVQNEVQNKPANDHFKSSSAVCNRQMVSGQEEFSNMCSQKPTSPAELPTRKIYLWNTHTLFLLFPQCTAICSSCSQTVRCKSHSPSLVKFKLQPSVCHQGYMM